MHCLHINSVHKIGRPTFTSTHNYTCGMLAQAVRHPLTARQPHLPVAVVRAGLQPQLSQQKRKALRAESQRLGKALCTVQLGQKGLSSSFFEGAWAALQANGLLKARSLAEGICGCCQSAAACCMLPRVLTRFVVALPQVKVGAVDESMEELVRELTARLDAVLVHRVGFTITLYRDPSLPPPPALAAGKAVVLEGGWEEDPDADESWDSEDDDVQDIVTEEEAAGGAGGGSSAGSTRRKPPEYTVIG